MIPTRRAWWLLWAWLGLALAAAMEPVLVPAWASSGGLLALLLAGEALVLARRDPPMLVRTLPPTMALGNWHEVRLRLEGAARRPWPIEVFDDVPEHHESRGLPVSLDLPVEGWVETSWSLRPLRRGPFSHRAAWVRLRGGLGLLERTCRVGTTQEVKVYPDFRRVAQYALLGLQDRAAWLGLHRQRRRGEGMEFHQLREYRPGDSLRQIDWKAVSRRRELISREYQEERNQQMVFLLDCGRRMHAHDGELSHFDHALNAVLLLGYVALRYGDAVGMMTFSGEDRWLPPVRGGHALNTLLNQVYDLQTGTAPSDYSEAARTMMVRQRRRALVVLITSLRDEDSSELPQAIALLRRRHLVVHACLRETVLDEVLKQPVRDLRDALRVSATHLFLQARRRAHDAVRRSGVQTLDVAPSELPAALVDRYLSIKRSGSL